MPPHLRHVFCFVAFSLVSLVCIHTSLAINGTGTLQATPLIDWAGFEVVTQNDSVAGIADAGYGSTLSRGTFDGLGPFVDGSTLHVYVNHEQTPAAISRVDLNLSSFTQAVQSTIDSGVTTFPASFVTGIGYAYASIYDNTYHAVNNPNPVATGAGAVTYANANFSRFCSGTYHTAEMFGSGSGFVDPMYITGEEVTGGKYYAVDPATSNMWEVDAFGPGSWENAATLDTGDNTHVAVILSSDIGSGGDYIRCYVGTKNFDANGDGQVDFLERNGLRGGTIYYFVPDSGSTTDLPDGDVNGHWSTSTSGALVETKLEDVHTNPLDGTQVAINASNDGVYLIDQAFAFLTSGTLDTANSPVTITQLRDDDFAGDQINQPDNLDWSADGMIYVQEDGSGNDMWQMTSDGNTISKIAHAFSEPSGIVEISELLGYAPGSVFLSSVQGSGSSGAQLLVLISPDAALLPQPGDFNGDGEVEAADLALLLGSWGASVQPGGWTTNWDGFVDANELAALLSNWGVGVSNPAPLNLASIPEPATMILLALSGCFMRRRRKV